MKRGFFLTVTLGIVAFLTIPLTGCVVCPAGFPLLGPAPVVTGSQEMATWEYDFADFTRVSVSSAFTVDITRSDSYRVSITANENLLDYLYLRQVGETLYIGLKRAVYTNTRQEATITLPELLKLGLSGASRGSISGFSSSSPLELDVSGASFLTIAAVGAGDTEFDISGASRVDGSLETGDCDIDLSGASAIGLEGSGNDANIDASGASSLRLGNFPVNNVRIDLSGASQATLNLSGTLDANLSGASHVKYLGEPTLGNIRASGGSTVSAQ
jgi:hypothetical protein